MSLDHRDAARRPEGLAEAATTGKIINAFFAVYDALGFGFLESVYCNALVMHFRRLGLDADREHPIDVWLSSERVGHFRADFLVAGRVIVEVKSSHALADADRRQMLNYLRASTVEVGLLLHFGPKPAFHRFYLANATKPDLVSETTSTHPVVVLP